MAKISAMMDIGKRAMMNSQTALTTVSHNIANKTTEGFSRQRVDVVANAPIRGSSLQVGMGARAAAVSRTNNPWLERQLEREGATLSFADTKAEALGKIENIFNEATNKGVNFYATEFFNSFRELANTPESTAVRSAVKESGQQLVNEFERVNGQLDALSDDLNKQIEFSVIEVNDIVKEVAHLNQKIQECEISGVAANDERDRRDLILKKLAEKINITYGEDKVTGMVNVTGGRTAVLVAGTSHAGLKTQVGEENRARVYYELSETGTAVDISDQLKRGKIGAALESRDKDINDMRISMDKIAYSISKEVNKAHIEGYDRNNKQGVLFFEMPDQVEGASKQIMLNKTIRDDVGRIAAAARPNAPGDNTVANVIHSIQFQKVFGDGNSTFDDFYNAQVGELGIETHRAIKGFESQKNITSQLQNLRESVSGVSLDEEAARMIEHQKAYEAAARMIKVADEMFDTVLNLKRM